MDINTQEGVVCIEKEYVKGILPKRKRDSHKGTYGKAAIVAGSEEYTGAAYLAAAACLRSGAGYTTLFAPKDILYLYALKSPEILLKPANEGGRYAFNVESMAQVSQYDSIAYGMGMGISKEVAKGAEYLLKNYEGKLLLDADGLNSLAAYCAQELPVLFANKKCDVILTPHVKEFSRLSGYSVEEIEKDGVLLAKNYAKEHAVKILLKSATSVITDGNFIGVNRSGNSGQAKGGSGDVLSGIIAGLCAMGATCLEGGCAGAFLAGTAAELAVKTRSEYSLTASDCIDKLGEAFLYVLQ